MDKKKYENSQYEQYGLYFKHDIGFNIINYTGENSGRIV